MFKIIIVAIGTYTDIQPLLALALTLKDNGYQILFITHKCYQNLISREFHIEFAPLLSNSFDSFLFSDEFKSFFDKPTSIFNLNSKISLLGTLYFHNYYSENPSLIYDHCNSFNPNAIISHHYCRYESLLIGKALRIPVCIANTSPNLYPSQCTLPTCFFQTPSYWRLYNLIFYYLLHSLWMRHFSQHLEKFRKEKLNLQTSPISALNPRQPTLCLYSSHLVTRPNDYPGFIRETGFCFLPSSRSSSSVNDVRLGAFLSKGNDNSPLIVFYFQHIVFTSKQNDYIMETILSVCHKLHLRGIIVGLSYPHLPPHIYICDNCDLFDVLSYCSTIVHCGSSDVVAISCIMGIPSVIFSRYGDQHYYNIQLRNLHVSPSTLVYFENFSENILELQLLESFNKSICNNITELSKKLQKENGLLLSLSLLTHFFTAESIPSSLLSVPSPSSPSNCLLCSRPFSLFNRPHYCQCCSWSIDFYFFSSFRSVCSSHLLSRPFTNYDYNISICERCWLLIPGVPYRDKGIEFSIKSSPSPSTNSLHSMGTCFVIGGCALYYYPSPYLSQSLTSLSKRFQHYYHESVDYFSSLSSTFYSFYNSCTNSISSFISNQ